jgi:hypothetical protein
MQSGIDSRSNVHIDRDSKQPAGSPVYIKVTLIFVVACLAPEGALPIGDFEPPER